MSPVAIKPKMNLSPEAAITRAPANDKNSARNMRVKGNGALELSEVGSSDKDASAASSKDDSQFSKVLESKNTPSRSNDSSPSAKNLNADSKISTKSEPQAANSDAIAPAAQKSQLIVAPDADAGDEQVSKEAAMSVFLERMQNELGVDPEQILQSFAQLDVSDLTAPPEQSLEKVIGQLNLPPAKAKQAEDMYAEMLALSATANMSEYLKTQNQTANMTVLSPKQAAQKEMQKNIGAMSDSFFAQKPTVQPQTLDGLKKAQGTQAYGKISDKDRMAAIGVGAAAGAGAAAALNAQDAAATEVGVGLEGFALPEGTAELSIDQQKSILAGLKEELAQLDAMVPPQAAGPESKAEGAKGLTDTAATAAPAAGTGLTAMSVLSKDSSSNAGAEKDSDSKDRFSQDQQVQLDPKNHQVSKGGQQFVVEAPKAGKAESQNNIQDIISNAQFLAKKGGGEMKVKMSPEGMGDVTLKVIVEKGQVNVEMIASNSESKKLLERGIDELKANLVSHKLHIDQIKVGGSDEVSKQMQNQHQQDDGQRNFQQKFLQDFKDQNNAARREIFDIGPARRPGSQIADDQDRAAQFASAKKRSSGSRRLDLVA